MKKETSLSEKIKKENTVGNRMVSFVYVKDVREAVLRLKEELIGEMLERGEIGGLDHIPQQMIKAKIDKIFGEKLTKALTKPHNR